MHNAHKELAEHGDFDYAADIRLALLNLKDPTIKKPAAPAKPETGETDATDELIWKKEVKQKKAMKRS